MRWLGSSSGFLLAQALAAQLNWGAAGGAALHMLSPRKEQHRQSAEFSRVDPTFGASVFLRPHLGGKSSLLITADYAHRSFHANYLGGGIGSGNGGDFDVRLDVLYGGVAYEHRIESDSATFVYIGLQVGRRMRAWASGASRDYGYGATHGTLENSAITDFGGDLRMMMGMRYVMHRLGKWRFTVNPTLGFGITSLLRQAPWSNSFEFGAAFGVLR